MTSTEIYGRGVSRLRPLVLQCWLEIVRASDPSPCSFAAFSFRVLFLFLDMTPRAIIEGLAITEIHPKRGQIKHPPLLKCVWVQVIAVGWSRQPYRASIERTFFYRVRALPKGGDAFLF